MATSFAGNTDQRSAERPVLDAYLASVLGNDEVKVLETVLAESKQTKAMLEEVQMRKAEVDVDLTNTRALVISRDKKIERLETEMRKLQDAVNNIEEVTDETYEDAIEYGVEYDEDEDRYYHDGYYDENDIWHPYDDETLDDLEQRLKAERGHYIGCA